jgi:hypothetical protein
MINDTKIQMGSYDGAASGLLAGATTTLIINRWYHVVCAYDGGTVGNNGHIYINGALEIDGNISRVPQQSTNYAMRFGTDYIRTAARDLVGTGRDLRFYNDAKPLAWARLTYLQTRKYY